MTRPVRKCGVTMIHVEFNLLVVNWIMGRVTSISFVVFVNGATYFLKPSKGLRHVCLLYPYLFLLVVECLSRAILASRERGNFGVLELVGGKSFTSIIGR